jgi:hypothetical protein
MSEPTYGSGSSYESGGQGYGGQPPGYGGQPPGGQPGGQPPGYAGQPQYGGQYPPQTGPPSGGFPAAGGYQSQGTPLPTPSAPRTPADRNALAALIVTIAGYVCAGAGLLAFILLLTVDDKSGTERFAAALQAFILGVGLGALNFAVGTWLDTRPTPPGSH